jgi:hypothetical protein
MRGSIGLTFREIERNVLLTITFVLLAYLSVKQSRSSFWSSPLASPSSLTTKSYSSKTSEIVTTNTAMGIIEIPKGNFASGAPLAQMAPVWYQYDEKDVNEKTTLHGLTVRPFAPHPVQDITCNDKSGGGLTYVHVQNNTGWMSTTPPSVHYRIAKTLGCDDSNVAILNQNDNWKKRDKSSFRWTTIQDPTHRLIHTFFFTTVSNYKKEPNDKNFHAFEEQNVGSQLMERLAAKPAAVQETDSVMHVTAIMESFDFVAVQERMEESLVAMSMLLGIPVRGIIHLSPAKVGWPGTKKKLGHFQTNIKDPSKCTYIVPAFVSPGLEEYFATPAYQNSVKGERILYQVANRTLDLTIATFNQKEFETNLNTFRQAQARALYKCQDEPAIPNASQFPCMRNGKFNTVEEAECVQGDFGCGFKCLDQVANAMNL